MLYVIPNWTLYTIQAQVIKVNNNWIGNKDSTENNSLEATLMQNMRF